MKTLTVFTSNKDATITAVAISTTDKGVVSLMMDDGSTKETSAATIKRWWKATGTVSEAEVLTKLTGKPVTEKDLDKAAAKAKDAPKATDKPAGNKPATKAPKTAEEKAAEQKIKDDKKAAKDKEKADKKVISDKVKADKKAAREKEKAEKAAAPKPFKIRGSVKEAIIAVVETLEKVEIADGYSHEVLVIEGVRKALFTGGAICVKVKDAETLKIAHEVKGYNHPFKARVTIEATDQATLQAALLAVINKL